MGTITMPIGDRCIVEDIVPIDEDSVRAAQVNLVLVTYDTKRPRPSTAIVRAVGSGPLIQDQVKEGDMVHFSPYAGHQIMIAGKQYRSLEIQEIILVTRGSDDELKKLNNPSS